MFFYELLVRVLCPFFYLVIFDILTCNSCYVKKINSLTYLPQILFSLLYTPLMILFLYRSINFGGKIISVIFTAFWSSVTKVLTRKGKQSYLHIKKKKPLFCGKWIGKEQYGKEAAKGPQLQRLFR